MTQKILVVGGTGRTGRHIVSKLVARCVHPHLIVRDIPKAQALFGDDVTLHPGDVRDRESLLQPMQGVSAVICAVGTRTPVGGNCPKRVDYEGVVNLVQVAQLAGVQRFILISSIAVTHPEHPLNHFGRILEWKRKAEIALQHSGMDYTIIRPGGLTDTPGGSHTLIVSQGDQVTGTLSRDDLAELCLQTLEQPELSRVTFEVIAADEKERQDWTALFSCLVPD